MDPTYIGLGIAALAILFLFMDREPADPETKDPANDR